MCAVCGSSNSDPDLGTAAGQTTRPTPFGRTIARRGAAIACDHCDTIIRYKHPAARNASDLLRTFSEVGGGAAKNEFLRTLACFLAIKQADGQGSQKVHKAALEKALAVVNIFSDTFSTLQQRSGRKLEQTSVALMAMPPTTRIFGLKDFTRSHGNPVGQEGVHFLQALVNDQVQVVVMSESPISQGRYELQNIVAGSAAGHASDQLSRLATLRADSLEATRLIGHLVSEYSSRARWQQEVNSLLLGSSRVAAEGGEKVVEPSPAKRSSRSSCSAATPRQSGQKKGGSAASEDEDEQSEGASDSESDGDDDEPPKHRSLASPAKPASSAASTGASFSTPIKGCRAAEPSSSNAATDLSASVMPAPLTTPLKNLSKPCLKILPRLWGFALLFVPVDWRSKSLQGKPKAMNGDIEKLTKEISAASTSRREDRLPGLLAMKAIAEACLTLVVCHRENKTKDFDNTEFKLYLHKHIAVIRKFIKQHFKMLGGENSPTDVAPELQKMQVALGCQI